MATSWYYVEGNDRVGPVDEYDIENLLKTGALNESSYIWKKGFESWQKVEDVEELKQFLNYDPPVADNEEGTSEEETNDFEDAPPSAPEEFPERIKQEIDWDNLSETDKIFTIKTGFDRGDNDGVEYGPYSVETLKKLYSDKRINGKSLIFVPGMDNWAYLADLPVFEKIFNEDPPIIGENERRNNIRKPFIARLLFHDSKDVYEGVCRDISVGGMQVLVAGFPGNMGDNISFNVHPDNSNYSFVASGKVVRVLDGKQGFSIRFIDLSNEATSAIEAYIDDI